MFNDPATILTIIVIIVSAGFGLETILDFLNIKARKKDIPLEVSSYYDKARYETSLRYHREVTKFGLLTSIIGFIATILMLVLGGFGWIDQYLRQVIHSELWLPVAFFGVIFIASDILTLPFQYYRTFVIEEKYGFNRSSMKTFFLDKLKGYLLGALIGIPILLLLIFLIGRMGRDFWWIFWMVAAFFMLFMNAFYTTLIVPLFNKLTPLEDGELKAAIETYSRTVNFPLQNIYVIDGSKRSAKSNAFFSGLGKRKKVVLYDTLIQNHTTTELVAVLAHEIGHYKRNHIIKGFILSIGQTGLMLFIMSRVIFNESFSLALGAENYGIHLNLLTFTLLYSPISTLLGIISNLISRRHEFQADAFASETFQPEAMKNALKKLSVDNLSNLYPHPAYVFVNYSHPPLLMRITAIDQASARLH
jgi:STE24 endopeptidase